MEQSECRARDDDINIVNRQYPRIIDSEFVKEEFDVFHNEFLFLVVDELAFESGHMSSNVISISHDISRTNPQDLLFRCLRSLEREHCLRLEGESVCNSIKGSCPISFMILLKCSDLTSYRTHTVCLYIP